MNLFEKILDEIVCVCVCERERERERERRERGWEQSKQRVARLLVTKYRDKYFGYSEWTQTKI